MDAWFTLCSAGFFLLLNYAQGEATSNFTSGSLNGEFHTQQAENPYTVRPVLIVTGSPYIVSNSL